MHIIDSQSNPFIHFISWYTPRTPYLSWCANALITSCCVWFSPPFSILLFSHIICHASFLPSGIDSLSTLVERLGIQNSLYETMIAQYSKPTADRVA